MLKDAFAECVEFSQYFSGKWYWVGPVWIKHRLQAILSLTQRWSFRRSTPFVLFAFSPIFILCLDSSICLAQLRAFRIYCPLRHQSAPQIRHADRQHSTPPRWEGGHSCSPLQGCKDTRVQNFGGRGGDGARFRTTTCDFLSMHVC